MSFAFLNEPVWFTGRAGYAAVYLIAQPSSLADWSKDLLQTKQIWLRLDQLVNDEPAAF
jgi:hypothetical protein